jgi:uncharacterized repeat protein (TIGR03803 family)
MPPPVSANYTVGGSIAGLPSGTSVVLQDNGGDNLTVSTNGSFTFPAALQKGAAYSVTVLTQPAGANCSVSGGTGTVASANITGISVSCTAGLTYNIGGSYSGVNNGTVVIQNNGGNNFSLPSDGSFILTTGLADGAAYDVTVLSQPAGQTCTVSHGTGTVNKADVTNVYVTCITSTAPYVILYTFGPTEDGLNPNAGLIEGNDGNFYGTTAFGTIGNPNSGGTIFKIAPTGLETILYSTLSGTGIGLPSYITQGSDGNLYGVTYSGGTNDEGTLFQYSQSGDFTLLHSFGGGTDGVNPSSPLRQFNGNSFLGMTETGGQQGGFGGGIIYSLTPPVQPGGTSVYSDFYTFGTNPNDGCGPSESTPLAIYSPGGFTLPVFFGVTDGCGNGNLLGYGTVFAISNGVSSVVYAFTGGADGSAPSALILGKDGNLYGTATSGSFLGGVGGNGGVLFKIVLTSTSNPITGTFSVLYAFPTGSTCCNALIEGSNGYLYAANNGEIVKVDPSSGAGTILHSFGGSPTDGAGISGLIQGTDGFLYGTTTNGGINSDNGTVFRIAP